MVLEEFIEEWNNKSEYILVHTSGSTGKPKPMMVEKERMKASARITCDFLGLKQGDTALLCMPLDYIAGKMVVVRSLVRNLRLISVEPSGHPLRNLSEIPVFAAMVPMQVYNSLQDINEKNILRQIKHLIIGGGAIDEELANELKSFPNAVWSTYGMTETLSHIALRKLNGQDASEWYTPFDEVSVRLNEKGCLVIDAPAVCNTTLTTNDRTELSSDGKRFRIIGRKDNVIVSGGIKIQIEEVERILHPNMHFPFMLTKKKDVKYGEIVVLLTECNDIKALENICKKTLPKYWQPKLYISVDKLPLTETGKPARKEAELIAEKYCNM
ncbi:MAG: AMP-binding protein [Prevotellaceae bacterium]|nr:AMP-binding protein [Prevotellaceae bacterium]